MGEKRVGGAHLFFLHSLMGIFFFFFAGATAPPSHYVAPSLVLRKELIKLALSKATSEL